MTEDEKILYGFGETKNIVAVQQISSDSMRLYVRDGNSIKFLDKKFYPFFFSAADISLNHLNIKYWKKKLSGSGKYNLLYAFETWSDLVKAVRDFAKQLRYEKSSFSEISEIYTRFEPITQFLIQSGETLFKGMNYDDLKILRLKILEYTEKFPSFSSQVKNQVFGILVSDISGSEKQFFQKSKSRTEKDVLLKFLSFIQEYDPDLVVGYNLYSELAYLLSRYKFYDIEFTIGRDGSEPFIDINSQFRVGEQLISDVYVAGRQIVDLLQIISFHDSYRREIEDYSLWSVAKHYEVAKTQLEDDFERKSKHRVFKDLNEIEDFFHKEFQLIKTLEEVILPTYFYQAQFIPMNFNQIIRSGVSIKIELMMVREYLRKRYSLPVPQLVKKISGGYSDIFYRGVFENVFHADVESLYPSIIISNNIYPKSDELKVFLRLIYLLKNERLKFKKLKEAAGDYKIQSRYNSMQYAFKILINSFYGYLGYFKGLFNDSETANEVTIKGQKLLHKLIEEFKKRDCVVIEVDTDGLYVSPLKKLNEEEEKKLIEEINTTIPEGINLTFSGRFKKMLSYKKKNYALLTYDNQVIIKGSALISKSFENYALKFIRECIRYILEDNLEAIPEIYKKLREDISNLKINISELAKTEVLNSTYYEYEQALSTGRRQRNAAYELAKKYYGDKFYPGMKISYYITGDDPNVKIFENCELIENFNPNFPDVNTKYYLKKLEEYVSRFEAFFTEEDFHSLFPTEGMLNFKTRPMIINKLIAGES